MDSERFTVVQLREILKSANLSQKSNKQELLQRLSEYDPSGTRKLMATTAQTGRASAGEDELHVQFRRAAGGDVGASEGEESGQGQHTGAGRPHEIDRENRSEAERLREKEREILRRERDLGYRELELVRREMRAGSGMEGVVSPVTTLSASAGMRPPVKALAELMS